MFNPTKKIGRSPKLQIKWEEEPYRVLGTLSDLVIKIESINRKRRRIVHRNQVKEVQNQEEYRTAKEGNQPENGRGPGGADNPLPGQGNQPSEDENIEEEENTSDNRRYGNASVKARQQMGENR